MALFGKKLATPSPEQALPGRPQRMPVAEKHYVLGTPLEPTNHGPKLHNIQN